MGLPQLPVTVPSVAYFSLRRFLVLRAMGGLTYHNSASKNTR